MDIEIREIRPGRWEVSSPTSATGEAVLELVADLARHVAWEVDLSDVRCVRGRPGTPGARYVKTYGRAPRGLLDRLVSRPVRVDCELDAVEPGHRVAWRQRLVRSGDASDFQGFDLSVTGEPGSRRIVLVRELGPDVAASLSMLRGAGGIIGTALDRMPADLRAELAGAPGESAAATPGDTLSRALEGLPARGPGTDSVRRLAELLDGNA